MSVLEPEVDVAEGAVKFGGSNDANVLEMGNGLFFPCALRYKKKLYNQNTTMITDIFRLKSSLKSYLFKILNNLLVPQQGGRSLSS